MAAKIETARFIVCRSVWNFNQRNIDPKLTSIAKMYARRVAAEVAGQFWGSYREIL
ncbi:MAG: acyl-CoA/acyl-ACP dehydrogenase [Desulfobacterales bacterium]|nr:acyl-CoA/acyl-ACP dehydrogenase [Desulfobacterales bacterium]